MNTVIIVSLIAIALSAFVGFAVGTRNGIKEGREELERELRHRFNRGVQTRN